MRIIYCVFALMFTGLVYAAQNEALTSDQLEVKYFIEKMYSYDPGSVEHGNFDSKLQPLMLNRVSPGGGKYNPVKQCQLLREFFEEGLIVKRQIAKEKTECSPGDVGYVLYPTLDDDNQSISTRYITIPRPEIDTPRVLGGKASVAVFTGKSKGLDYPRARSLFFLTKSDQGWRISNFMLHRKWPDLDDRTNNCYFVFAREPSADEEKEIPHHCRR
ncbi:hypothetical protein [Aromatoleum diolicum]|uniref:Uncharacterized protein n=1 Tax=Aromatoleum diolicum TaxID=75796 RepID=A0ABX1QBD6_9RHOO|nr:hypothetical protein [Aromatoleum diolicum]NMG74731.1 hypothetical protein [Aromatoleum diolicum]